MITAQQKGERASSIIASEMRKHSKKENELQASDLCGPRTKTCKKG
jgi:hypothetical protein